ncbi:EAL domain-containing protein [Azospirillum sp. sgz302134]
MFPILSALAATLSAAAIGALSVLRPEADAALGGLAGATALLSAGLVVDIATRRKRERAAARRLDELERTVATLAGELSRHKALIDEGQGTGAGAANYETVVQEVRLLQSLVSRLGEKRPHTEPPRPPAAAANAAAPPLDDSMVLEAVRDALAADRIDIYLQPVVGLPQRKHRYYEVFSRVRAPDGSLILPDRYLDIAEREGLIATIDNLLLVRCVQLIRETEVRQHAIGFFSNISAATLSDADFMEQFLQLMAQNQALVPKLMFELSQEQIRAGGAVTLGILGQLARIGFRFSMDQVTDLDIDVDALLRHDFRCLKLDCALVLDPANAARIEDLLRRAEGKTIDIIVEKIETEAQLAAVLGAGFDVGQGYLFGEPRPARRPD